MSKLVQSIRTKQNKQVYTENRALTNKSTLSDLLDFYYHAPARRGQDNTTLFGNALSEDEVLAIKTLFYVRDIRGGQGERKTFRDCLNYLFDNDRVLFNKIFYLVPEYGRWDDILGYPFYKSEFVQRFVVGQLMDDCESERPTLLAKWMPSINTSSKQTVGLAYQWAKIFNATPSEYRKMLSFVRNKISLVETQMSDNEWNGINYERVPSKASLKYRKAFKKHDEDRYTQFLQDVMDGKKEIKASTLYPYEIVGKVLNGQYDQTLEGLWKNLPNYAETDKNALVVADVSGSMSGRPMEVSISLAMYLAERNNGIFKDTFITFSAKPELQEIKGRTLRDKVVNLSQAHWDQNTNLQAVFELILNTGIEMKLDETEMPEIIFIVSDMEFDIATRSNNKTNFEKIQKEYRKAGYEMPKLVFWNVSSRNDQTPVTMNEEGVYLVSGCSPVIFKNAVNTKTTNPMDLMLEVLNQERYDPVEKALSDI